MTCFDISRWHAKILFAPANYESLSDLAQNREAITIHTQGNTLYTVEDDGTIIEKALADYPEGFQEYIVDLTEDGVNNAISIFSRQMYVLAATYGEAILEEFFIALFSTHPKRMNEYVSPPDQDEKQGKIALNDFLEYDSKESFIEALCVRAAKHANSGKTVTSPLKRAARLSNDGPVPEDLNSSLNDLFDIRNRIVHEAHEPELEKKDVMSAFNRLHQLLVWLGTLALKNGVEVSDQGFLLGAPWER